MSVPPKIVTVFGSGVAKETSEEYKTARALGRLLANEGFAICNGGYKGIMEASARGAKEAGGKTIGITTSAFEGKANPWIDEERCVPSWRERLFSLIETGEAYVFLDGGTGTLAELFTVWEMTNKRLISKPLTMLGFRLKTLTQTIQKWPQVIRAPDLSFAETPEETLQVLTKKWCQKL